MRDGRKWRFCYRPKTCVFCIGINILMDFDSWIWCQTVQFRFRHIQLQTTAACSWQSTVMDSTTTQTNNTTTSSSFAFHCSGNIPMAIKTLTLWLVMTSSIRGGDGKRRGSCQSACSICWTRGRWLTNSCLIMSTSSDRFAWKAHISKPILKLKIVVV